ncbi:hypothetical protein PFISCL1PPCAC_25057, partial [Pristionchus fissidentatus]
CRELNSLGYEVNRALWFGAKCLTLHLLTSVISIYPDIAYTHCAGLVDSLLYTLIVIIRENNKVMKITRKFSDQGNKMLQIQLWGSTITFIIPMSVQIAVVKFGLPTSSAHLHS